MSREYAVPRLWPRHPGHVRVTESPAVGASVTVEQVMKLMPGHHFTHNAMKWENRGDYPIDIVTTIRRHRS